MRNMPPLPLKASTTGLVKCKLMRGLKANELIVYSIQEVENVDLRISHGGVSVLSKGDEYVKRENN